MIDIPELTEEQFARALPARVRKRFMLEQFESGEDIPALRRFVGLTLLTFFETLFKRGAFRKAKQIYQQAADLLAQVGSGSHEQMRQVWRHLLRQIEEESLKEYQLQEVRQYACRHWNTPAPRPPFAAIH